MKGNQETNESITTDTTTTTTTIEAGKNFQNETTNNDINNHLSKNETFENYEHCVLHMHGLHHSGTGFLRQHVYEAVGGKRSASQHEHTGKPEDEGQHMQDVYMTFFNRYMPFPKKCFDQFDSKTRKEIASGRFYYCPEQLSLAENPENKERLFQQWANHWDMSKPYLIQKSPTLDIALLEAMKIQPTVHFAILRHPFNWHFPGEVPKSFHMDLLLARTFQWLDAWSHVFDLLASGKIKSYAVIQYEVLVEYPDEIKGEISNLVQSECSSVLRHVDQPSDGDNASDLKETRRELELHKTDHSEKYLRASKSAIFTKKKCLENALCREMMDDMLPVISQLGYDWNIEGTYFTPLKSFSSSKLLFSSQAPPPAEFVAKIKTLAERYIGSMTKG